MLVRLKAEAREDIDAGANFYRDQNRSTGDHFIHSVRADIDEPAWQGGVHAIAYGYHLKRVHRFPFGIYYYVEDGVVEVIAVFDLRGHPHALRRRLNQRRSSQKVVDRYKVISDQACLSLLQHALNSCPKSSSEATSIHF